MKILVASSLMLLALSAFAQDRQNAYQCARTIEYRCYVQGGRGNQNSDLGYVRMDENSSVLEVQDRINNNTISVTIDESTPSPLLRVLAYDDDRGRGRGRGNDRDRGRDDRRGDDRYFDRLLGGAVASYGSAEVTLLTPVRNTEYLTYSCVAQDRPSDSQGRVYVSNQAPPANRAQPAPRPRQGYVWMPDTWENYNGRWTLKAGYWTRARANKTFEEGGWFFCDGRYRFADHRWR